MNKMTVIAVILSGFLVFCDSAAATLSIGSGADGFSGDIAACAYYISMDNVGHMVHTNFTPASSYSFEFVNRSKNITDGSDFNAVRNAFRTWVELPSSDIFFEETGPTSSSLTPGHNNGRNEISWLGTDDSGDNLWKKAGFSSSTIATVLTWYYPISGQVIERDMYFNDIDMDWCTDTDGTEGQFYVEHIALHEAGHIYGLKDVYNPGQAGYRGWMGGNNQHLTMYGYSCAGNKDITLTEYDIYAMALAHPSGAIPEPPTSVLFALAGCIVISTVRIGGNGKS